MLVRFGAVAQVKESRDEDVCSEDIEGWRHHC